MFLVDVYCLGVKNAFWHEGTAEDVENVISKVAKFETMKAIAPLACRRLSRVRLNMPNRSGSRPIPTTAMPRCCSPESMHRTVRTTSRSATMAGHFTFRVPTKRRQAAAIMKHVQSYGVHFFISVSYDELVESTEFGGESDRFERG